MDNFLCRFVFRNTVSVLAAVLLPPDRLPHSGKRRRIRKLGDACSVEGDADVPKRRPGPVVFVEILVTTRWAVAALLGVAIGEADDNTTDKNFVIKSLKLEATVTHFALN
ncbi:MAG: hypothetical protein LH609_03155 [Rudanella sp.]|nr:hypothetical protein [Rudanella sp.]